MKKESNTQNNIYQYIEVLLKTPILLSFVQILVINWFNQESFLAVLKRQYGSKVLEHTDLLLFLEFLNDDSIDAEIKQILFYKASILGLSNDSYGDEKNNLFEYIKTYLKDNQELSEDKEHVRAILGLFKNLIELNFDRDFDLIKKIVSHSSVLWIFTLEESFSLFSKFILKFKSFVPDALKPNYQDGVLHIVLTALNHYPSEFFKSNEKESNSLNKSWEALLETTAFFANEKSNPFSEYRTYWETLYLKIKSKLEDWIDFEANSEETPNSNPPSETSYKSSPILTWWANNLDSAIKAIDPKSIKEDFTSLIWMEKVKEELRDIISYFKNKEEYKKFKVEIPKWMILYWNPWVGKTAIARALAKEAWVPFFYISGSEFIELYVWVWPKRVRELFAEAKKKTPSIIYIDEIDAIGSREETDNSERKSTVNQILTEMDWFKDKEDVFVIGSTNFVYNLDKALLRSGRFEKKIKIPLPDKESRVKLFDYFISQYKDTPVKVWEDESPENYISLLNSFSKETSWLSPADIRRVVWDMIRLSFREEKTTKINKKYFELASKQLFDGNSFETKSQIKEIYGKDITTNLSDLVGMDSVKEEVKEVLKYFENPESFAKFNINPPRWILFYGPPWTGKTAIAKAIAKEAWVPFFYISASELKDKYIWESWKRVKELFSLAREKSPSLIFIDEIDNIWNRETPSSSSSVEADIINQFLTEMDWFKTEEWVVVVAATNYIDKLDLALTRKGRFDKKIKIPLPDKYTRKDIFEKYISQYKSNWAEIDPKLNEILERLVEKTTYYSPAKIEGLVKDAVFESFNKTWKPIINELYLDNAWRKSEIWVVNDYKLKENEKYDTAVHEAGHAIVSRQYWRPINEISIISTGQALWYVLDLEKDSRSEFSSSQEEIREDIDISMWGRAAEELFLKKITTWISWDMKSIKTRIENMMDEYMFFWPFLTEKNKIEIMKKEFSNSESRTKKILIDNKDFLEVLVKHLLEKERINQIEFETLWNQFKIINKPNIKSKKSKVADKVLC